MYKGEWQNDVKHGKAEISWGNAFYSGFLVEGLMSGRGVYSWADGRMYDGEWYGNSMHGQGRFDWPDGRMYFGRFERDKKHGYGELTYPSGQVYLGHFENGKRHGRGCIWDRNTNMREDTIWKDGNKV